MNKELKKIKVCCVASADITLKFMLFNQLRFLQSRGYEVYAICSPGKWVNDIEKHGIKVAQIKFKRKMSPLYDIISFLKIYFYFLTQKFDVVHVHTLKPEFYGQIAAKLAGVPIIMNTIHGFDFGDETPEKTKKFFLLLQKIAAKFSDIIFAVSWNVIDIAKAEKICDIRLLKYLGRDIDFERFDSGRFSGGFISNKKKELGIPLNKKIIGIVARLVKEKGYPELFSAMEIILKKFPDTVLVVVGQDEPEKKDALHAMDAEKYKIEKNTIFLGERTDVDELYPVMDIFVLPTHREGIGASILEASAMERPVIATKTGGCPEAVENGKTGILIPVGDSEKLAEAIVYLLENPDKAREMGKAGREKILREYSKEVVFKRLGQEYNRLIDEKLKNV